MDGWLTLCTYATSKWMVESVSLINTYTVKRFLLSQYSKPKITPVLFGINYVWFGSKYTNRTIPGGCFLDLWFNLTYYRYAWVGVPTERFLSSRITAVGSVLRRILVHPLVHQWIITRLTCLAFDPRGFSVLTATCCHKSPGSTDSWCRTRGSRVKRASVSRKKYLTACAEVSVMWCSEVGWSCFCSL